VIDDGDLLVEIHIPLEADPNIPEDEEQFPWIEDITQYLLDLDEGDEAAMYDDGEEFGEVYVFSINAADENTLLSIANRIANLPGVPTGVFAMVTSVEAESFGEGRKVEIS